MMRPLIISAGIALLALAGFGVHRAWLASHMVEKGMSAPVNSGTDASADTRRQAKQEEEDFHQLVKLVRECEFHRTRNEILNEDGGIAYPNYYFPPGWGEEEKRLETEAGAALGRLDCEHLKKLILSQLDAPDLSWGGHRIIVLDLLQRMVALSPAAALDLMATCWPVIHCHAEDGSPVSDPRLEADFARLLAGVAENHPDAAISWYLEHRTSFARSSPSFLSNIAATNLPRALAMTGGLPPEELKNGVACCADLPPAQAASPDSLAGFRDFFGRLDPQASAAITETCLAHLGQSVSAGGFTSSMEWLDNGGLTQEEKLLAMRNMGPLPPFTNWDESYLRISLDLTQWLAWYPEALPEKDWHNCVSSIVTRWNSKDSEDVRQWLDSLPEGPLKDCATAAAIEKPSE